MPEQATVNSDKQSDAKALLERFKAGDASVVGPLLESYESYLTLLAQVQIGRRLQGKADAVDLVQETFLDAHRQIKHFRGTTEAELIAWLRTILAGQIALMLRRYLGTKGRNVQLERELEAQLDESSRLMDRGLVAAQSTPSQKVSRREQGVILAQALDRLAPDYRQVIVLRHVEGLAFQQVAERMGKSEDSVQKLWVRALAKLKGLMGASQ